MGWLSVLIKILSPKKNKCRECGEKEGELHRINCGQSKHHIVQDSDC